MIGLAFRELAENAQKIGEINITPDLLQSLTRTAHTPVVREARAMFEKVVVVTRKTRLEELIERFNTRAQAKFYIEHSGGDFDEYVREDDTYRRSLDAILTEVEVGLKVQRIDRSFVPTFFFSPNDLVVTVGQDGLVANCAKYVGALPVVAINPDPARFDGVLLPFIPSQAHEQQLLAYSPEATKHAMRHSTLAEVTLNDGQRLLAFNDLFIGTRTHTSARYRISFGATKSESQSSSGIIVSTGAGSTGWLSSVFNMARGVAAFTDGTCPVPRRAWQWDAARLAFIVREPFASRYSQAQLVAGQIDANNQLTVESSMPTGGVIFSDGVEADFIAFNSGTTATFRVADRRANLVVPS